MTTDFSHQYQSYNAPELTFIGSQQELENEYLHKQDLWHPFVILRYRPKCDCGKEFRSSGEDTALQQVAKHLEYKKYKDCKPIVEKLTFDLPEFVAISQVFNSEANRIRNQKLLNRMEQAEIWKGWRMDGRILRKVIHRTLDGQFFNMNTGEYYIPPTVPTKIDGYQIEKNINLKATVTKKSKVREVLSRKTGDALQVCEVTLTDDTGSIQLTLWNGQTKEISEGDKVIVRNGFVKDAYRGGIELGLYKNASKVEVDNS